MDVSLKRKTFVHAREIYCDEAEKRINKFLEDNAQICVSVATQHNEEYREWVATIVYIPKSPK